MQKYDIPSRPMDPLGPKCAVLPLGLASVNNRSASQNKNVPPPRERPTQNIQQNIYNNLQTCKLLPHSAMTVKKTGNAKVI